jgi:hypothetical protein
MLGDQRAHDSARPPRIRLRSVLTLLVILLVLLLAMLGVAPSRVVPGMRQPGTRQAGLVVPGVLEGPPPTAPPPPRLCTRSIPKLSGVWFNSEDRGYYFLRQIGTTMWWAGLSWQPPQWDNFQLGLSFSNVFHGTVREEPVAPGGGPQALSVSPNAATPTSIGTTVIEGDWADVPRGTILGHGSLRLLVDRSRYVHCGNLRELALRRLAATGGFAGAHWNYQGPALADGFDIRQRFSDTQRNDGHTMAHQMSGGGDDNEGIVKDAAIVLGRVLDRPTVNFPGWYAAFDARRRAIDRSYARFICAKGGFVDNTALLDNAYKWFDGGGDPPDGDLNFNIDTFPFLSQYDNSLAFTFDLAPGFFRGQVHAETIMYGRDAGRTNCTREAPSQLPGWADTGSSSALINGRPMNGRDYNKLEIDSRGPGPAGETLCQLMFWSDKNACWVDRIGPVVISPGQLVRLTGVLGLDLHAGDENGGRIEIHPVYSIDVVNATPSANLTGVWAGDDKGTYFIRQLDPPAATVWWLGLSADRGRMFANVFHGKYVETSAGFFLVSGSWADVPMGPDGARSNGMLSFDSSPGNMSMHRMETTGGFGGSSWMKLYKAP